MGDSHLAEIRKHYGSQVEKYCKNENVLPTKLKCGALKLKNLTELMVCENIRKGAEARKQLSRIKKLNAAKRLKQNEILEKENEESISLRNKKKESGNDYLNKVHMKVILHDTSAKVSALCPSKKSILDKAISGTKIYNHIMKTKVRSFEIKNDNDISSSQQLISILELFQEKHKRHNYKDFLRSIVDKNRLNTCEVYGRKIERQWQNLDNYEITAKQLSVFFTQILILVVPIELFGSLQNREIFTKLVCCILRSARFQPIYLKPYIKKLNIKKMAWLQSFKDESVQWFVTLKLVKWLLLQYIIKILYRYIHVTVHPSAVGKRLYFRRYLWNRMKERFVQKNIKHKVFIPLGGVNESWHVPVCEYKLLVKNIGLRPIVKLLCSKDTVPKLELSLQFLRQLCVTHYGLTSMAEFREKWKTIVRERSTANCNDIWLVSCDLDNAYGSIILGELVRIIRTLSKDLPTKLKRTWVACLHHKHKHTDITYTKHFSDLMLAVPAGTLCTSVPAMATYRKSYVTKSSLIGYIRTCILLQRVEVDGSDFLIGKGVLQGTRLANVLFDIYYGYVCHRRLSIFLKSGTLFRYVDDVLYITENLESAKEFIKKIEKGFTTYNCKFKASKVQTNFSYEDHELQNEITYLGWRINCNTLEVLPHYSEVHPSYLFTVELRNRKRDDSITLLKSKLCNQSYLRLSDIILSDSTTFIKNVMSLVKKIAAMHAWRALMFTRKLFKEVHKHVTDIFTVIKRSNEKILKALLNLYTEDMQKNLMIDSKQLEMKMSESLWAIIKRVFFTDSTFRDAFKALLMREIRRVKI